MLHFTTFLFQVQSSCLFNLLLSLETPSPDPLHIAELIKEEKPLKPIDFCYRDEDEMVNVLDCISLCVMVVSYSAESMRGYQMLVSKVYFVEKQGGGFSQIEVVLLYDILKIIIKVNLQYLHNYIFLS